ARAGGAHVRVAVVAVDAPRVEHPLEIDQLVARAAEVIHDLLRPALDERLPDAPRDIVEHLVPGDALPIAATALALAPQRIADALRVVHLIHRGHPLAPLPPAPARVDCIAP